MGISGSEINTASLAEAGREVPADTPVDILFDRIQAANKSKNILEGRSTWAKVVLHFDPAAASIWERHPDDDMETKIGLFKQLTHYQELVDSGIKIPDDALREYLESFNS